MLIVLTLIFPALLIGAIVNAADDDDDDAGLSIEGTDGADTLEGGQRDDRIDGGAGDDVMEGLAGNDTILGREGEDVLQGQDGDDLLCSGEDDDIVTGNRGSDFIEGQEGDDFLSGDYGSDVVRGDDGNDTVIGGRGYDVVSGLQGDDILFGGILEGLPLNLEEMQELRDGVSLVEANGRQIDLRDDSMGNELYGGAGDDDLIIGSMDSATGGAGMDTFHIMADQNNAGAPVINDYDRDDDSMTIIVNGDTDLDVTVTVNGDDAVVRLGGTVLARVTGASGTLTAADITLITEAAAAQLFDPNASA